MGKTDPLAEAHAIRHAGINRENAGKLEEAERLYDQALAIYREHDHNDTLGYANAVRYPAVVKNKLGKRDESRILWREAYERYDTIGIAEGIAEAALWLTIFAIDRDDVEAARDWFEKAFDASSRSTDPKTHKFIDEVRGRLADMSVRDEFKVKTPIEPNVVRTRHVLAVKDLRVEAEYYIEKLGFDRDFTVPGWEFLSFGDFKVMLGECPDDLPARDTGCHSWFAHVIVENVDEIYESFIARGAVILSPVADKPWDIREFSVETPGGHRIVFGQAIDRKA